MQRRINQIIELNELRCRAYEKVQVHQEKMKKTFDSRVKEEQFQIDDLVLKWDAPREEKHGKFDHMWKGPYIIATFKGIKFIYITTSGWGSTKMGPCQRKVSETLLILRWKVIFCILVVHIYSI